MEQCHAHKTDFRTISYVGDVMKFVHRLRLYQKPDKIKRHFTWRPTCIYMTDIYNADKLCSLWGANWAWRQSASEENTVKNDRLYTYFKGMEKTHSAKQAQKWQSRRIFPNLFTEIVAGNILVNILSCSIVINLMVYPTTRSFQINVGLTLAHNPHRASDEAFRKKRITVVILYNWPIKHEIH